MVKRHKSGRRQILQLEDKKPPPVTFASTSKVKSLIHYSDSDDDSKSNPSLPDVPASAASEVTASAAAPMDSQVEDFLKEIDALAVTVEEEEEEASEVPIKNANKKKESSSTSKTDQAGGKDSEEINGKSKVDVKQDASEICSWWQQCHDESSGYSYFWNVQTNEVTWECPPEYMAYLEYLKSASAVTAEPVKKPSAKRKAASEKEEKPSSYLKEGAIIPISYFGYSSSDSSDEETAASDASATTNSNALSTVVPPTVAPPTVAPPTVAPSAVAPSAVKSKSQVKSKTSKKATSEPMGPQLPPNFQFSVEVPISPSQSKKDTKSSKDKKLPVMGPQLPQGYFTEPDGNNTKKDKNSTSVSSLTKDSSEQLLNDKLKDNALVDKPKDNASVDKPRDNASVDKPKDNASVDKIKSYVLIAKSKIEELVDKTKSDALVDKHRSNASLDKPEDDAMVAAGFSENDNDWEESLLDMEKQFQQTKKLAAPIPDILTVNTPSPLSPSGEETAPIAVDETPDSATIKELPSTKRSGEQSIAVSTVSGNPVVEYNFTDSEDEADVVKDETDGVSSCSAVCQPAMTDNSSPLLFRSNTPCINVDAKDEIIPEIEESNLSNIVDEGKEDTKSSLDEDGKSIESMVEDFIEGNDADAGVFIDTRDHCLEYIPEKRAYTEIVNDMFTFAKESTGKFGFGFSRSQQLQLENGGQKTSKRRRNKNYPMISFVKSKRILDLKQLNEESAKAAIEVPVRSDLTSEKEAIDAKSVVPEKAKAVPDVPLADAVSLPVNSDSNKVLEEESIEASKSQNVEEVKEEKDEVKEEKNEVKEEKNEVNSKKIKAKKKSQKKEKKDQKPQLSEEPAPSAVDNSEVDDIDQLLGNILKEMVESGEATPKSATESIVNNTTQDSKKRANDETTTASAKKRKKKKEGPKEPTEKDSDVTTNIVSLSTELMEKITFLVTNHTSMASLSGVLVQVQTRLMDWQAGYLDGKYFMDRLQDVQQYLQHCEASAVPGDWTCQWDSDHKRYFYVNEQSQISQWMFPTDATPQGAIIDKTLWSGASTELPLSSSSAMQFPRAASCLTEERVSKASSCTSSSYPMNQNHTRDTRRILRESSPPPPPPGVDTPPPAEPPPPMTPPPDSPPPPPPDSVELEEGEIPDVDMDLEDSNSGDSISFAGGFADSCRKMTNNLSGMSSGPVFLDCPSTALPEHHTPLFPLSIVSSTSTSQVESSVRSQLQQSFMGRSFSATAASNAQTTWTAFSSASSCSSAKADSSSVVNERAVSPLYAASGVADELKRASPVEAISSSTSSNVTSKSVAPSSNGAVSSAATKKEKEKEKKKSKLRTSLSFKKRNIPSLVQKWQKIKEEQEKEDKDSDNSKMTASIK